MKKLPTSRSWKMRALRLVLRVHHHHAAMRRLTRVKNTVYMTMYESWVMVLRSEGVSERRGRTGEGGARR